MISNLPLQLKEAVGLFEQFERSVEHEKRIQLFSKAVHIIDTHLSENRESQHKEFLTNLKLAYTRKLLEQISEDSDLPLPDEDWFSYLLLTLRECKSEVEQLTKEYPSLKQSYDNFIQMWGDDALILLERRTKELEKECHLNV